MFEKLASLKTGKAPGPDAWPAEVFKQCADQLCVLLSILFNKSLESSVLPDDWKIGYITPIYKKGNKTKVDNYRPVCLTSIAIKIFESIIKDTLSNYLSDNNLLSPNQHGFVPRRSCCTQLLHALNDWTLSLDERLSTDVVYFDFSKAFDSVPHTRLLLKLQAYGINGQLLSWFKSFLWVDVNVLKLTVSCHLGYRFPAVSHKVQYLVRYCFLYMLTNCHHLSPVSY